MKSIPPLYPPQGESGEKEATRETPSSCCTEIVVCPPGQLIMSQPNILIFMTDHQRGDTAPPYVRAKTPHLDRISKEGLTFSQAYCPAPHCCPSRATFMSGLYPTEHGVWNNVNVGNALSRGPFPDLRFWSEDLREAGYRLHYSGKWHVSAGESPVDRGWEMTDPPASKEYSSSRPHLEDWNSYHGKISQESDRRGEGEIIRPGYPPYRLYGTTEEPFNDQKIVEDALQVISDRSPSDQPWCHFVGTLGPHDPYLVPKEYLDIYNPAAIELPPSFGDSFADRPGLYRRTRHVFDQLTLEEHRDALHHFLAFVSYEDALFGRIINTLEEKGELDNTLVIYTSDHGDYAGDHGLWTKGLPCFRGAYHIPSVIRWPDGIEEPGRIVDAFISLADFAPTLLAAAGIRVDRQFSGSSLLPFFHGERPAGWRDAVHTQTNGNELYGIQRSVMTTDWKYVYNGFDYDELYNLENDPHETTNLAGDPAYRNVTREMYERIWKFAREHRDTCVNPYIMVGLAEYGPGIIFD